MKSLQRERNLKEISDRNQRKGWGKIFSEPTEESKAQVDTSFTVDLSNSTPSNRITHKFARVNPFAFDYLQNKETIDVDAVTFVFNFDQKKRRVFAPGSPVQK
jgi:hypothetical protein